MDESASLFKVSLENGAFEEVKPCNSVELAVKEKKIEEWIVKHPQLLFTDPDSVMVIAQEISGEPQADILALDSQGNLIIIEIKRHWSDRNTIGQLLDYAARLSEWEYEAFNQRWQKYRDGCEEREKLKEDLYDQFTMFVENPAFDKNQLLKMRRLFVLASEGDASLKRIVKWLRDEYKVPIDFVPFGFYKNGEDLFLRIQKIEVEPLDFYGTWAGDWFFNTDETHSSGAWKKMLDQSVIAAFGYGAGLTRHKMDLPNKGDRVFAYVNGYGFIAIGTVIEDESFHSETIFAKTKDDEFHRKVQWLHQVPLDKAVTAKESTQLGYNLPIRCTIGKMYHGKVAGLIAQELEKRNP